MDTGDIIYFVIIIAALIISAITKASQAKRKNRQAPVPQPSPPPLVRQKAEPIETQTDIESLFEKIILQEKEEDAPVEVEEVEIEVEEPVLDSTESIEYMSEEQLHKEHFNKSDDGAYALDQEEERHLEVDLRQAIIHNAILNRPKL